MEQFVIGTAGHIDHGKTLLTHALTGVDTDRLPEEKAKGISIELGFAPLTLDNGVHASIVDVPGHERFVKTMLAGASGIDAALLVVAADDGVMPQTVEHFDILKLLQIPTGLVAVTKADLVTQPQLDRVIARIQQLTAGSFLQDAPILPVSALTGQGIPALRQALSALSTRVQSRDSLHPLRLPIDRAFTISGQGTIVTGTLVDGSLSVGDSVMLYPQEKTVRVRSLQIHGKGQDSVAPGARTAAALTNVEKSEIHRGSILALPGSLLVSELMDVSLQLTADCPYRIKNNSQLHLYCGTQEGVARLRLLQQDSLSAGQSGMAQLKLTQPMAVRNGDRFILRFFSPMITIGGGTILDAMAVRHRRNALPVLQRLDRLNSDDPRVRLVQRIADADCAGVTDVRLSLSDNLGTGELSALLTPAVEAGELALLQDNLYLSSQILRQKTAQLSTLLQSWHRDYPLMQGMPLAQLRTSGFRPGQAHQAILSHLIRQGHFVTTDSFIALPDFTPVFTQQHKIMQRKLLHHYRDAWFRCPDRKLVEEKFAPRGEIFPQVLRHMLYNRMLVPLTPRYAVHHEAYAQALQLLHQLADRHGSVTLAQFRTATDTSRKFAQLYLEHWDSVGVTRRQGDAHYITGR